MELDEPPHRPYVKDRETELPISKAAQRTAFLGRSPASASPLITNVRPVLAIGTPIWKNRLPTLWRVQLLALHYVLRTGDDLGVLLNRALFNTRPLPAQGVFRR